jgi:hypothetical protein
MRHVGELFKIVSVFGEEACNGALGGCKLRGLSVWPTGRK